MASIAQWLERRNVTPEVAGSIPVTRPIFDEKIMTKLQLAVVALVAILWGLHTVVMKAAVDTVTQPIFYAAVRMTIVAVVLLPFLKWHRTKMLIVWAAGLCYGAFNYALMFPAVKMTTAAAAAVTLELCVPFSIILSWLILAEKVSPRKSMGIVLAFIGVAVVAFSYPAESAGPLFLVGIGLVVLAALCEGVGAVLVKILKPIKPLELSAWFGIVGAIVLWPLTIILEQSQLDAFAPGNIVGFTAAVLFSAIGVSVIAHSCYYWLLHSLPVYKVASAILATIVVAILASAVFLDEALTVGLLSGSLMVLVGIAVVLVKAPGEIAALPNPALRIN